MLTGQNPFEADSVVATMHRIASGDPPPWDNVPRNVIPVFQRLLACNREDRYQSADELRGAIAEIRASARMLATPQDVPLWRRALSMFAPRK
jgi:hypothetical protein